MIRNGISRRTKLIYSSLSGPAGFPFFQLPLKDSGAGAVGTTPEYAAGSITATFTRATAGWTKLSTGLWASVNAGVARSCYLGLDTTVGAYGGYLPESLRINNGLWSRDLTNPAWASGGGGVATAKNAVGIDGAANSCTTLTASGANGTLLQSITLASQANVFQPFIKRVTGTGEIDITLDNGATWTDVTSQINSSTFTLVQATKTAANPIIGFRIVTAGDVIVVDMADMQSGTFASTPIPTTTIAVQRNDDILTFPIANNIGASAGSAYAEISTEYTNATTLAALQAFVIQTGAASNVPLLIDGTSGTSNVAVQDSTAIRKGNVFSGTSTIQKIGSTWSGTSAQTFLGGVASSSLTWAGPFTLTTLSIGNRSTGGIAFFGTIRNLRIYPVALSAAQMQALTT